MFLYLFIWVFVWAPSCPVGRWCIWLACHCNRYAQMNFIISVKQFSHVCAVRPRRAATTNIFLSFYLQSKCEILKNDCFGMWCTQTVTSVHRIGRIIMSRYGWWSKHLSCGYVGMFGNGSQSETVECGAAACLQKTCLICTTWCARDACKCGGAVNGLPS